MALSASQSRLDDPTRRPSTIFFSFFGSGSTCGSRALAVLLILFLCLRFFAYLLWHSHLLISRRTSTAPPHTFQPFNFGPIAIRVTSTSRTLASFRRYRHISVLWIRHHVAWPQHKDRSDRARARYSSLAAGQVISHHGLSNPSREGNLHQDHKRAARQCQSVDLDGKRHKTQ